MIDETEFEKKICPKCNSLNVQEMGAGHVAGVGEPMKDIDRFQYECCDCRHIFRLLDRK